MTVRVLVLASAVLTGGCDLVVGEQPTAAPVATLQPQVEFTSTGTERDGWWWLDEIGAEGAQGGQGSRQESVWRLTGFDVTRAWGLALAARVLYPRPNCGDCAYQSSVWWRAAAIHADGTVDPVPLWQEQVTMRVLIGGAADGVGSLADASHPGKVPGLPAGSIGIEIRMWAPQPDERSMWASAVGTRASSFWLYEVAGS
jgi:hypothetical protein